MKRSVVWVILLLCLALFGCRESAENSSVTLDIPNIDHNILDADRHLGNSFENYSSEDTLLVEYGNRIFHAYNSRHEIMEYCTEDGKEKPLGIYGTNLSVYKNVLYYIAEDGLSIHAYDLATCTDSVWITGEEVDTLLPKPTYQYPRISDLIVTDYGMCMLYGSSTKYLVILNSDKEHQYFLSKEYLQFARLIPISNENLCITGALKEDFTIVNIPEQTVSSLDFDIDAFPVYVSSNGNNSFSYYDISDYYLRQYDLNTGLLQKNNHTIDLPYYNCVYALFDNSIFYNTFQDYNQTSSFWILSLSEDVPRKTGFNFGVFNLSITSDKTIYGIAYNPYGNAEYKYFKSSFDFTEIIWL